MDEEWLQRRVARTRRALLEGKDRLARSARVPEGEIEAFRKLLLDEMASLEADLAAVTKTDLVLDSATVNELARILRATAGVGEP